MPKISAEAATKEFLSQPPTNQLDSLIQDSARLFIFSKRRLREGESIGTKIRRKLFMWEAVGEVVANSGLDPGSLYLEVARLTSVTPEDVFPERQTVTHVESWGEHFLEATAVIVELEAHKRFPALRRAEEARYSGFTSVEDRRYHFPH